MSALTDLVRRNRSCRRFASAQGVNRQMLMDLVDVARLTASAANRQPLRYMIFSRPEWCGRIFPHLRWAAALKEWNGPAEHERPSAYVFVLACTADGGLPQCDAGIAMQTLLLAATERGLSGCILGAVDRAQLMDLCRAPAGHELLYVIALGYSAETCVIEAPPHGGLAYYRDAASVHHVPKRPLNDVLLTVD